MKASALIATALLTSGHVYGAIIPEYQVIVDVSRLSTCPQARSSKLYRLFNPDKESYAYTTSLSAAAAIPEEFEYDIVAARLFETVQPSTVPLYHILNEDTLDSFYTRDPRERDALLAQDLAYVDHGVAGYVFPRRVCGSRPFFRLFHREAKHHFYTTDQDEVDRMIFDEGYTGPVIAGFVISAK
ncbi:hypothetical protein GGX14DRAFT_181203 [Mycena pura]|uniref:DUF5648 domain-containing protein n=1 Tax=Mycena pura TaxID=153505 RepID=A0AAD6UZN9_9AGAR|nr:hypothetical protein GGX14DRAFT_181203 [Mycena pura]